MPIPSALIQASAPCLDVAAFCWLEERPGLAAWAQAAIGLSAVIVAYIGVVRPLQHQRRENAIRQSRLRSTALEVADQARAAVMGAMQMISSEDQRPSVAAGANLASVFAATTAPLQEFPINELDDAAIRTDLRLLCTIVETSKTLLNTAPERAAAGPYEPSFVEHLHAQGKLAARIVGKIKAAT